MVNILQARHSFEIEKKKEIHGADIIVVFCTVFTEHVFLSLRYDFFVCCLYLVTTRFSVNDHRKWREGFCCCKIVLVPERERQKKKKENKRGVAVLIRSIQLIRAESSYSRHTNDRDDDLALRGLRANLFQPRRRRSPRSLTPMYRPTFHQRVCNTRSASLFTRLRPTFHLGRLPFHVEPDNCEMHRPERFRLHVGIGSAIS